MTNILDLISTALNGIVSVWTSVFQVVAQLLSDPFGVVAFIAVTAFVASVVSLFVRAARAGRR